MKWLMFLLPLFFSCTGSDKTPVAVNAPSKDWAAWCNHYRELYDASEDSSRLYRISLLDSIISYEDTLLSIDTLRKHVVNSYFDRIDEWDHLQRYHQVVNDCEKYFRLANNAAGAAYLVYANNLAGKAWEIIGDSRQAMLHIKKQQQIADTGSNAEQKAIVRIMLANSYRENGEEEKAIATANEGLLLKDISEKRRAYLHAVLAETYLEQEKPADAEREVNEALPLLLSLPRNDDINDRLFTVYRVQADIFAQKQQPSTALKQYRQALTCYAAFDSTLTGRDVAKTFNSMGRLYTSGGHTDSAIVYLNRALRALFPHDKETAIDHLPPDSLLIHENTIMEIMDAASETYRQQYAQTLDAALLQKALNCIDLAFKVEELLRQQYIYDDSKYDQGNESKHRSQAGIDISRLLWGATGKSKWLDEAFMYAEKSRANVLMDKIKENLLAGLSNDSSFAETKQLWLKIQKIDDQLREMRSDKVSAETQALMKDKEQLETLFSSSQNRVNTLLQAVYKEKPPVTVADVRKKIFSDNDAIVEYFAGDSLLYRFVLQKKNDEVAMMFTPLKPVDSLVKLLMPYLTERDKYNDNRDEYNRLAGQLYKAIFPVLKDDEQRVMIVADGLLQLFPFEALVADAGKPEFLLNKHQFSNAFSCISLLQQVNMDSRPFAWDAVAFAPFTETGRRSLSALPLTKNETGALRNLHGTVNILNGEKALSANFMKEAGKGKILHIASHAFASSSDAAQPRIEFFDSSLSLEKIYSLRLNNRLVVLSACQTGIGKLVNAEGALSLARGFYYAGAHNVINSLWEADDQSAGIIFEHFYRYLKKSGNISEALSLARRDYFKEAPPEKQSPYYWASFVCIGDGEFNEAKTALNKSFWIIFGAGALGVCLLMIFFTQRRRDSKGAKH